MATHSSIFAWRIPWTEEPGGLQSTGLQRDTIERLHFAFTYYHYVCSLKYNLIFYLRTFIILGLMLRFVINL